MVKGKFKGIKIKPGFRPDPPPYAQLDRIERMLKWLILKTMMVDSGELAGMNYSPEAMGKQIDELVGELPDISDIISKK